MEPDDRTRRAPHDAAKLRRRRVIAGVAAAAVLALGAGAVWMALDDDEDSSTVTPGSPESTTTVPETTVAPDGSSTTSTTPRPAGAALVPRPWPATDDGRPAAWLRVGLDGTLALVDTASGQVVEEIGRAAEPNSTPDPETDLAPAFVDRAWRVPGTEQVFVSWCCEPAGGNVTVVDDENPFEEGTSALGGYAAVPSPDGQLVASASNVGLRVVPISDRSAGVDVSAIPDYGSASVAWLRDRRGLVWTPGPDPEVVEYLELDDSDEVVRRWQITPDLAGISVAAAADGSLYLAGCTEDPGPDGECEASALLELDPADGSVVATHEIEPGSVLGGYDPTGEWLVYTDQAGTARWRSRDASGVLGEGVLFATW